MLKRKEIESLMNIFQRSEKIKKELIVDKLMQVLCKTHITLEEMDEVSKLLKTC